MYVFKQMAIISLCGVSGLIIAYYAGKKIESITIEKCKKQMEANYD